MTIEIITAHEADQLIRLRRPLGTDQQGRHPEAAHACTDVGADEWVAFTVRETVVFWSVVIGGTAALGLIVAVIAGWRPFAGWLTW